MTWNVKVTSREWPLFCVLCTFVATPKSPPKFVYLSHLSHTCPQYLLCNEPHQPTRTSMFTWAPNVSASAYENGSASVAPKLHQSLKRSKESSCNDFWKAMHYPPNLVYLSKSQLNPIYFTLPLLSLQMKSSIF